MHSPPDNSGSNFNQITSVTRCFRRTGTFLIVELSHLDAKSARINQESLHLLIENYATIHFRYVSSFLFFFSCKHFENGNILLFSLELKNSFVRFLFFFSIGFFLNFFIEIEMNLQNDNLIIKILLIFCFCKFLLNIHMKLY